MNKNLMTKTFGISDPVNSKNQCLFNLFLKGITVIYFGILEILVCPGFTK